MVMATPDILRLNILKRCVILFGGTVQVDNIPKAVFSSNNFYATL
ncbi:MULTISPECIES: hypothetical protein [Methanobacterium]|nr:MULTISPECIES: hypothetical protein [Methanobacterium]MCZ3365632.1 hypothetical protein [Methanobacterium veterum]